MGYILAITDSADEELNFLQTTSNIYFEVYLSITFNVYNPPLKVQGPVFQN